MATIFGENAFRVGGSVRDEILGRKAKDGDYVVRNHTLDQMHARLATSPALRPHGRARKSDPGITKLELRTGQHVGWRLGRPYDIEIAMPRAERAAAVTGDVGNVRHAFEIEVDPAITLAEDALRRDFTMNAIYRNVATGGIADPLDGQFDIDAKLVRTTHESSFRDDPLRTLRALRFVATLGFDLTDAAYGQMFVHSKSVTGLTGKGVSGTALDELCKLLMGRDVAKAMRLARDSGVLAVLVPELAAMLGHDPQNSHHEFTTDEHTFTALNAAASLECSLAVRLALLFHDSGKPAVEWIGKDGMKHFFQSKDVEGSRDHEVASAELWDAFCDRMNVDRKLRQTVRTLILRHMVPLSLRVKPSKVRKWRTEIGDDMLADLFKHRLCDVIAKGVVDYEAMRAIARLEEIREDAVRDGVPVKASDLPISGHDIIALGITGPAVGEVLAALLHEVVSQPDREDREWLLSRAAKLASKARV